VVVDSGSTDETFQMLPARSTIHRYVGRTFNYSEALNQGIELISSTYTLIISSHTSLENERALEYAIDLLARNDEIGAAYFCLDQGASINFRLIDATSFTGFNGLFNTCGVVRTALLKKRPFRPEVFSAEDQEWSKWLLEAERKLIARISGGGMNYRNPFKKCWRKRLNEFIAVASYTKPELLRVPYLACVAYRIIRPVSTFQERLFNVRLMIGLLTLRLRGTYFYDVTHLKR
jgi:glycosyltransferase involved in cell wall biosynthesis